MLRVCYLYPLANGMRVDGRRGDRDPLDDENEARGEMGGIARGEQGDIAPSEGHTRIVGFSGGVPENTSRY